MDTLLTPAELGAVLRTIRGPLSQRAFATQLGIRQEDLAKAERGRLPGVAARLIYEATGADYERVARYRLRPDPAEP